MTGKSGWAVSALLFCTLLSGGCNLLGGAGVKTGAQEVEKTAAEKQKARLLKSIERRFENPDAHFELGRLYQADGLWAKAEYHYNIVLGFDPVHRQGQAARVKVLQANGDEEQSQLSAEFYINQASSTASGSLKLGLAFQQEKLDDYALRCYRQALGLAPNSAKINRQIGYYYLVQGDKERAGDYLRRSFQLNANQPEVAYELGRLGIAAQIPRRSEKDLKKLDKIVEKADSTSKR